MTNAADVLRETMMNYKLIIAAFLVALVSWQILIFYFDPTSHQSALHLFRLLRGTR